MTSFFSRLTCVLLPIFAISLARAQNAPPSPGELGTFQGKWLIRSASPGPWAENPSDPGDEKIAKGWIGKTVTFMPKMVKAPQPLGCQNSTYSIRAAEPDSFFEGGLAQGPGGKTLDTAMLAKTLGITSSSVKALTASCSEVEFYQIAPDVLLFGMDNRIYRLERQKP